ncbi:MAG: NAD-dependent epimerase/dehydratase family protein, partial [Phycisphaerae bacterium]|nr:NAD-dependent epimerase/dehydratase family protein [Phycisphaerae bacterium]
MNILITGGAGFIGSHLAEKLVGQGHRVHLLDNLSTGRRENVSHLLGDRCELQVSTVTDALADQSWVGSFDQIYHLAAAVGVQLIVDDPEHTIETNVLDTAAILRAATSHRVPILITSSSEVYGKSDRIPFAEDDDVIYGATRFSRWSYAVSKAVDEYLGLACHQQHGLGVIVVRLFNTIGPGQVGRYGMVVPRFIEAAVTDRPLEIYGDGRQTRCFCHVSDVIEAMTRLLDTPECHGRVFNVGSEEEV